MNSSGITTVTDTPQKILYRLTLARRQIQRARAKMPASESFTKPQRQRLHILVADINANNLLIATQTNNPTLTEETGDPQHGRKTAGAPNA